MIQQIVNELGPWNWMVLGIILLGAEILVPGVFLIWIGLAAIVTGVASLLLWETGFWSWQVQTLVFLALSLLSAWIGKRIMDASGDETDEPLLNRRQAQLVGRVATLEEPIRNGRGRVRIGDTLWRVTGADMDAGTRVRVTAEDAGTLRVEPES
ncbi:MAG: NfeD family protein [Zhengella sp.]|uniref:NfeD family protein n=1 Tax=Zhengella sp. TaxID=2282762 RepID=UPI001E09497F|nr:NfeD family protein [Notoacmeibacter sp.]MCC0027656.1 NfeD family protein [Brucellaceae bacterium]